MKIETKYHGEIEVEEKDIVEFRKGIPGFLEEKKFTVLTFLEDTPFRILQSIQMTELAFVVIEPFSFFPSYEFELPDQVVESLNLHKQEDVIVFGIVTIHEDFEKTTVNLQAPIVINGKQKLGQQVVLNNPTYATKHKLFQNSQSVGQEG